MYATSFRVDLQALYVIKTEDDDSIRLATRMRENEITNVAGNNSKRTFYHTAIPNELAVNKNNVVQRCSSVVSKEFKSIRSTLQD